MVEQPVLCVTKKSLRNWPKEHSPVDDSDPGESNTTVSGTTLLISVTSKVSYL